MRRRVMMGKSNYIPGKSDAVAGDILCAKEDGSKKVFKSDEYTNIKNSGWTPIGIVVIPPSHNVYGTGEGAVVALRYPSTVYPDEGWNYNGGVSSLFFGGSYNSATGWGSLFEGTIYNYNEENPIIITTNNLVNETLTLATPNLIIYPNLKDDDFYGTQCVTDPHMYYDNDYSSAYKRILSPYLPDGSRNPSYYTSAYGLNICSDFSAKEANEAIIKKCTYQSDWKTATNITLTKNKNHSPLLCAIWRYHTIGTKQGDWYLPNIAEMGYLKVRAELMNEIGEKLRNEIDFYTYMEGYNIGNMCWVCNCFSGSAVYSQNNESGYKRIEPNTDRYTTVAHMFCRF